MHNVFLKKNLNGGVLKFSEVVLFLHFLDYCNIWLKRVSLHIWAKELYFKNTLYIHAERKMLLRQRGNLIADISELLENTKICTLGL